MDRYSVINPYLRSNFGIRSRLIVGNNKAPPIRLGGV
jgi:hypothetical protein